MGELAQACCRSRLLRKVPYRFSPQSGGSLPLSLTRSKIGGLRRFYEPQAGDPSPCGSARDCAEAAGAHWMSRASTSCDQSSPAVSTILESGQAAHPLPLRCSPGEWAPTGNADSRSCRRKGGRSRRRCHRRKKMGASVGGMPSSVPSGRPAGRGGIFIARPVASPMVAASNAAFGLLGSPKDHSASPSARWRALWTVAQDQRVGRCGGARDRARENMTVHSTRP